MKARLAGLVCVFLSLAVAAEISLHAQQRPGGGPPGSPPPGMPGGPPPPGSPGGPPSPGGPHAGGGSHSGHDGVQFGPVGRWWDDKLVAKTIGLSSDQKKKMDAIFDAHKPEIVSTYKAFLKEQARLESLSKDPHADQVQTFAQIDAVNQARAALQKATAQMFLEIRQQMDPDQIDKLEKLQ